MAFMVVTLCSLVSEGSHVTHQNQVLQKPSTAQQIKKSPENILAKFRTLYRT
jgi:methionine-rich copper-binding protein CopC